MNFASDNAAGIAPEIMNAMVRENAGHALGYGNDDCTRRVETRIAEVFEREVAVFLVPTGTAANALALAHLSPPWGAAFCHAEAHVSTDECGAPEFYGGGLKLVTLPGEGGKIAPAVFSESLESNRGAPHRVTPSVLSITQATEFGTIYTPAEVRALADIAHDRGMSVHMDGARFGNAMVRLGVTPAEATWKAGVDVLSFGATKAGALAAEAVVFFNPQQAVDMASRRKRGAQLISKHRFLAAQFEAYLHDGLWLRLAQRANDAASRLADKLASVQVHPVWPVEANEIFAVVSAKADARLKAAGAQYYAWKSQSLPNNVSLGDDRILVRLVTSFVTTDAEIDQFASLAG